MHENLSLTPRDIETSYPQGPSLFRGKLILSKEKQGSYAIFGLALDANAYIVMKEVFRFRPPIDSSEDNEWFMKNIEKDTILFASVVDSPRAGLVSIQICVK